MFIVHLYSECHGSLHHLPVSSRAVLNLILLILATAANILNEASAG